jgi:hypothetical protein
MKRVLLFKRKGGHVSSYGTAVLLEEEEVFITSHPLDPEMGVQY